MSRTTVTLDPDVEMLLARVLQDRGITFKEAVNDAIRAGLTATPPSDVSFPTYDMGEPHVDVTLANRLASQLEDDEISRKLAVGR